MSNMTKDIQVLKEIVRVMQDVVDMEADGFDMEQFNHDCGAPACMIGFAANDVDVLSLLNMEFTRYNKNYTVSEKVYDQVHKILGGPIAGLLFSGSVYSRSGQILFDINQELFSDLRQHTHLTNEPNAEQALDFLKIVTTRLEDKYS